MTIHTSTKETVETETQTRLQCYPFVIKENQVANVQTEHAVQTLVSINPKEKDVDIYDRLTHLSDADLLREYSSLIIIPKTGKIPKLQFVIPSRQTLLFSDNSKESSEEEVQSTSTAPNLDTEEKSEVSFRSTATETYFDAESKSAKSEVSNDTHQQKEEVVLEILDMEHRDIESSKSEAEEDAISGELQIEEERKKGVLKKRPAAETNYDPNLDPELLFPEEEGVPFLLKGGEMACQTAQTNLSVKPHYVDNCEESVVVTDLFTQTSVTCLPEVSSTTILSELKKYHDHSGHPIIKKPGIQIVMDMIQEAKNQHYKMLDVPPPTMMGRCEKQSNKKNQNFDVKQKHQEMGDSSWDVDLPEIDSTSSDSSTRQCDCGEVCMCPLINQFIEANKKTNDEFCDCNSNDVCFDCKLRKYVPPITECTCNICPTTDSCGDNDNNKPCPCTLDRKAECICTDKIVEKKELCRCMIDRRAKCICKARYKPPIITPPGVCPCTLDRDAECICNICKCSNNFVCGDTCIGRFLKVKCECTPTCQCKDCVCKMYKQKHLPYDFVPTCPCSVCPAKMTAEENPDCACRFPCKVCTTCKPKDDGTKMICECAPKCTCDVCPVKEKFKQDMKLQETCDCKPTCETAECDRRRIDSKVCTCTETCLCEFCQKKKKIEQLEIKPTKKHLCKCEPNCNCEDCYYKKLYRQECKCAPGAVCTCLKMEVMKYREADFIEKPPSPPKCECTPACICTKCLLERENTLCTENCECDNCKATRETANFVCDCSPCQCEKCKGQLDEISDACNCTSQCTCDKCRYKNTIRAGFVGTTGDAAKKCSCTPQCRCHDCLKKQGKLRFPTKQIICECNPCDCNDCPTKRGYIGDFENSLEPTKCQCLPSCTCDTCMSIMPTKTINTSDTTKKKEKRKSFDDKTRKIESQCQCSPICDCAKCRLKKSGISDTNNDKINVRGSKSSRGSRASKESKSSRGSRTSRGSKTKGNTINKIKKTSSVTSNKSNKSNKSNQSLQKISSVSLDKGSSAAVSKISNATMKEVEYTYVSDCKNESCLSKNKEMGLHKIKCVCKKCECNWCTYNANKEDGDDNDKKDDDDDTGCGNARAPEKRCGCIEECYCINRVKDEQNEGGNNTGCNLFTNYGNTSGGNNMGQHDKHIYSSHPYKLSYDSSMVLEKTYPNYGQSGMRIGQNYRHGNNYAKKFIENFDKNVIKLVEEVPGRFNEQKIGIIQRKSSNNIIIKYEKSLDVLGKIKQSISEYALTELKRNLHVSESLLKHYPGLNLKYSKCKQGLLQIDTNVPHRIDSRCNCFVCTALALLHPKDCSCILCSNKRSNQHPPDCVCSTCATIKKSMVEKPYVENPEEMINVFVDYISEEVIANLTATLQNKVETTYNIDIKIILDYPSIQQKTITLPHKKPMENQSKLPQYYKNPLAGIITKLILNDVITILGKYNFVIDEEDLYDEIDEFTHTTFRSFFQRYGIKQKNKINVICSQNEKLQNIFTDLNTKHNINVLNKNDFNNIQRNLSINILKIVETNDNITIPILMKMIPVNVVSSVSSFNNILLNSPSFEDAKKFVKAECARVHEEIERLNFETFPPDDDNITLYKDVGYRDDQSDCFISVKSYAGEDIKAMPIQKLFNEVRNVSKHNKPKSDVEFNLEQILTSIKSSIESTEIKTIKSRQLYESDSEYFMSEEMTDSTSQGISRGTDISGGTIELPKSFETESYQTEGPSTTDESLYLIHQSRIKTPQVPFIPVESKTTESIYVTPKPVKVDHKKNVTIKPEECEIISITPYGSLRPDEISPNRSYINDWIKSEYPTKRKEKINETCFVPGKPSIPLEKPEKSKTVSIKMENKEVIVITPEEYDEVKVDISQLLLTNLTRNTRKPDATTTDTNKSDSTKSQKIDKENGKTDKRDYSPRKIDKRDYLPGKIDKREYSPRKTDKLDYSPRKTDESTNFYSRDTCLKNKMNEISPSRFEFPFLKSDKTEVLLTQPDRIYQITSGIDFPSIKSDKSDVTDVHEELLANQDEVDLIQLDEEVTKPEICLRKLEIDLNELEIGLGLPDAKLTKLEETLVEREVDLKTFQDEVELLTTESEKDLKSDMDSVYYIPDEATMTDVASRSSIDSVYYIQSDSNEDADSIKDKISELDSVCYIDSPSADEQSDNESYKKFTEQSTQISFVSPVSSESFEYSSSEFSPRNTEIFGISVPTSIGSYADKINTSPSSSMSYSITSPDETNLLMWQTFNEGKDELKMMALQNSENRGVNMTPLGSQVVLDESYESGKKLLQRGKISKNGGVEKVRYVTFTDTEEIIRVESFEGQMTPETLAINQVILEDIEREREQKNVVESEEEKSPRSPVEISPVVSKETTGYPSPPLLPTRKSFEDAKVYVKRSHEEYTELHRKIEQLRMESYLSSDSLRSIREKIEKTNENMIEKTDSLSYQPSYNEQENVHYLLVPVYHNLEESNQSSVTPSCESKNSVSKKSSFEKLSEGAKSYFGKLPDTAKSYLVKIPENLGKIPENIGRIPENIGKIPGNIRNYLERIPENAMNYLGKGSNVEGLNFDSSNESRDSDDYETCDENEAETRKGAYTSRGSEYYTTREAETATESEFYTSRGPVSDTEMEEKETGLSQSVSNSSTLPEPQKYSADFNICITPKTPHSPQVDVTFEKKTVNKVTSEPARWRQFYSPPIKETNEKTSSHTEPLIPNKKLADFQVKDMKYVYNTSDLVQKKCKCHNSFDYVTKDNKNTIKLPSTSSLSKSSSFNKNFFSKSLSCTSLSKVPSVHTPVLDLMDKHKYLFEPGVLKKSLLTENPHKPRYKFMNSYSFTPTTMNTDFAIRNIRRKCSACSSINRDPVLSAKLACEAELEPIKEALNTVQTKLRNLNMPELDCILCKSPDYIPNLSYLYPQAHDLSYYRSKPSIYKNNNYLSSYDDFIPTRNYFMDNIFDVPNINIERNTSYNPDNMMPLYKKNFSGQYRYPYVDYFQDYSYLHQSPSSTKTKCSTSPHKYSQHRFETSSNHSKPSTKRSFYSKQEWDELFGTDSKRYSKSIPSGQSRTSIGSTSTSTVNESTSEEETKRTPPEPSKFSLTPEEVNSKHTSESSHTSYYPFIEAMKRIAAKEKTKRRRTTTWYDLSGISGFENMTVKIKVKPSSKRKRKNKK